MPICCDTKENLGCYGHCALIETGLLASSANGGAGAYVICDTEGNCKSFDFTLNQKINFINFFNEDKTILFYITNPIGQAVLSPTEKECFQVVIQAGIDLT